jgi:hypothetical protein
VTIAVARTPFRIERHALWLALLTVAFSIGWFLLDGHLKINFADEGFLWYGAEALRRGEVPMRDFSAYDPGRYVWTAAWSYVLGDSLVSLRLACVYFQILGVFAGLLVARRLSKNWIFLVLVAFLLCAWMHPRFKLFEQSIALMAVYASVLLLENPSMRRHFWVGVFGGISAFFGRNHGAYHIFAFGLLIAWNAWGTSWTIWVRRSVAWGIGLLVGYLPQLLMFLFVSGFFDSFMVYISGMVRRGSTNVPTGVPWPWLIRTDLPPLLRFSALVEAWWYVAVPVFFILALVRMAMLGRDLPRRFPVLVGSVLVGLAYAHFIFSRPDLVHLTHGAPIIALGALALAFSFPAARSRFAPAFAGLLLVASLLANLFQFGISLPIYASPLFDIDVGGSPVRVEGRRAQVLESARYLSDKLAPRNEAVLFMPHFPALYPFTGRKSPTKEIYFTTAPDEDQFLAEIKKADVRWIMLQDYALDGRNETRFRNTNPRSIQYFRDEFDRVAMPALPKDIIVLHRRSATPP